MVVPSNSSLHTSSQVGAEDELFALLLANDEDVSALDADETAALDLLPPSLEPPQPINAAKDALKKSVGNKNDLRPGTVAGVT